MIIVFNADAKQGQQEALIDHLSGLGFDIHKSTGMMHTVIGVIGETEKIAQADIKAWPGVSGVYRVALPYRLVARLSRDANSQIRLGGALFGGPEFPLIAGPCAIESQEQVAAVGAVLRQNNIRVMRGGLYKPRTSPYAFQGLGREGIAIVAALKQQYELAFLTEVMECRQIEWLDDIADAFQVGARNMQNYALLTELGRQQKPVLLKRGSSATLEELLLAAEYIHLGGNSDIILCERGIRAAANASRFILDIAAIPMLKRLSHLPVVVDPSHAAGSSDLVPALAHAALAAGADGLLIETHPQPHLAKSDGQQALTLDAFSQLVNTLRSLAPGYQSKVA
jgi:3-deoxy-7-phosphoheptulonate synthase